MDIWHDLHRHAVFGSHKWRLNSSTMKLLMKKVPLEALGYGLRGFFDAEGSCFISPTRKNSATVSASSVNYRGLRQVSRLLVRLGIRHNFWRNYRNTINMSRRVGLEDFQKRVGFSIGRKREKLERAVKGSRSGTPCGHQI